MLHNVLKRSEAKGMSQVCAIHSIMLTSFAWVLII